MCVARVIDQVLFEQVCAGVRVTEPGSPAFEALRNNPMTYRASFSNGKHLAAARVLTGLKQTELAALARIHVNSLKRLERMERIDGSVFAVERIGAALRIGIGEKGMGAPIARIEVDRLKAKASRFSCCFRHSDRQCIGF